MRLNEISATLRGDRYAAKLVTASPAEPLYSIAMLMRERNVGTVVLVESRRLVGIVTDRDLALAMGADAIVPETPVAQVMTTDVKTIPSGATVYAATQYMKEAGVRRLPIVDDNGRPIGIISFDDLVQLLGRELRNLGEGVRRGSQSGNSKES